MNSKLISQQGTNNKVSKMAIAIEQLAGAINTEVKGLYGQTVIIKTGNVTIKNSELDCEFDIPFDDNTEANEAELTFYNLSTTTINNIKTNAKITVTAGYGNDTGIIFSGFISTKKTYYEGCDKITKVTALDDMSIYEKDIESFTYAAGTKASKILKDLCIKTGLPIAEFKVESGYTYKDEETVDGGLMENITRVADVCKVSAYIQKSKIYVRPLSSGDNTKFVLSSDTGLIDYEEYTEENTDSMSDETSTITGYNITMLLQHQVQAASIIKLTTNQIKGTYRVKSGSHTYNGTDFFTKVKVVKQ